LVPVASSSSSISPAGSWPDELAADLNGNIWFTENQSDQIGEMQGNSGAISTFQYQGYTVPTANGRMTGIAVDATGTHVWASETANNNIARLDLTTAAPIVTEISAVTTTNSDPVPGDVSIDFSGVTWFIDGYDGGSSASGFLASVNPTTYAVTAIAAPTPRGGLDGLAFDYNGNAWIVETSANKVATYAGGVWSEYSLPRSNVTPTKVAPFGGLIYVTEESGNAIAVLNPAVSTSGQWTEFAVPTSGSGPTGIAADPLGNIWFTEFNTGKIGLLQYGTTSIVDFAIPTANCGPEDVTVGPTGRIFFTEEYGNKIGEIAVPLLAQVEALRVRNHGALKVK
jgi:virginiamycin B lyase